MRRAYIYVFVVVLIIVSFSACISEKDRADMQKMLDESTSKASSVAKNSSVAQSSKESSTEASTSEPESRSEESGATEIDNKQEPQQGNQDGITIHIPQSDIDKFNSELSEITSEFSQAIDDLPVYSYDSNREDWQYTTPDFEEVPELEYSEPTEWREYAESKRDETAGWQNED